MTTKRPQIKSLILMVAVVIALSASANGQAAGTNDPKVPAPKIAPQPRPPLGRFPTLPPAQRGGETSEKLIAVDPKVNVSLCVTEGVVKINGWGRNEVRVFVNDGSSTAFKVANKNSQTSVPNWIFITGRGADEARPGQNSECLWGNDIEIDVPAGATVNVKGRETRTRIDSVRKASIKNVGGDITLRNVTEGISASTYEGDLLVENSGGAIALESATGNIIVFEAVPSEIGDIFKAKSNSGAISLQKVDHRQIEVGSITGSVNFNGSFSSGGLYAFATSNGAITLGIPADSSLTVTASFGYGDFNSDVPMEVLTENVSSTTKRTVGRIGGGDSNLNLTTTTGSIRIKKQ